MTGCDHVRPDIGAYVLGGLEPAEEAAVREHLATCSECAAEHARLSGLPALLALAAPLAEAGPPAPALEERVLDAVAQERPRRAPARARVRRPRVLAAAGLALAAVAAALVIALGGEDERAAPAGYEIALRPVAGAGASGRAELTSADGGTTLHLWVDGLPADPGIVYEVQCDAPGWTASAGTFRADSHGRAYVTLTTAARRGEYDAIRVVRRTRSSETDVLQAQL